MQIQIDVQDLRSVYSPGVNGVYTLRRALSEALEGTGARFAFEGDRTVRIGLEQLSETVEVVGRPTPSSLKYTAPLLDTPQTIYRDPGRDHREPRCNDMRDVLRNVPGLTVNAGEGGGSPGDNLVLRGFSAANDIFIDGARDLGPQSRDPFNVEQVEVVKGPQSAFTGRGSSGGSINLSSKTVRLDPFINIGTNFGTDGTKRGTADLNTPVPFLGERTGLRLNLMGHQSGVAGRDVVKYERWGVAPTLSFGLGTPTNLVLGYSKLKQDNISDYGIPWVPANNNVLAEFRDQPAPVPRETFYGFRDRDHELMGSDAATVRFKHSFSDNYSVRNQFRYGRSTRDSIATPPRFARPDSTVINREMRAWLTEDEIFDNQADLRTEIELDRETGEVVKTSGLSDQRPARRMRTWIRWIHTGEAGGWIGQTIAGVASFAGVMLVWTGLTLSLRRFTAGGRGTLKQGGDLLWKTRAADLGQRCWRGVTRADADNLGCRLLKRVRAVAEAQYLVLDSELFNQLFESLKFTPLPAGIVEILVELDHRTGLQPMSASKTVFVEEYKSASMWRNATGPGLYARKPGRVVSNQPL